MTMIPVALLGAQVAWNISVQASHNDHTAQTANYKSEKLTYAEASVEVMREAKEKHPGSKIKVVAAHRHIVLPQEIQDRMKAWNHGVLEEVYGESGRPSSYTAFHIAIANVVLDEMKEQGYTVHRRYPDSDGWGTGNIMHAIVEDSGGRLVKLKYNEFNQDFMEVLPKEIGGAVSFLWRKL